MLRPEDCIPGTLVECIDDKDYDGSQMGIVRGRVYTIEDLIVSWKGEIGVSVREVTPMLNGKKMAGFLATCFRPLPDERLSIFRQMLAPAPKKKERV